MPRERCSVAGRAAKVPRPTRTRASLPAEWAAAGPGWTRALPFTHGLELAPGDWLQVWVHANVREPGDPAVRAVRLFVGVPG